MSERIPIHGSMTRPSSPNEGVLEMTAGRVKWSGGNIEITVSTDEFTSVCPTTGQPDFNSIKITYKPNEWYVESKTMKFYLWSFREWGAHCETLSKRIADDITTAVNCEWVEVEVNQFPRGGLKIISKYTTK